MEKPLLLQGKIPKLQQLIGKNWLQYGRACCQSRVVGGRCWIIGQQTIAERNVEQTKDVRMYIEEYLF